MVNTSWLMRRNLRNLDGIVEMEVVGEKSQFD